MRKLTKRYDRNTCNTICFDLLKNNRIHSQKILKPSTIKGFSNNYMIKSR